jgi:biopolymer transport protein TolQ
LFSVKKIKILEVPLNNTVPVLQMIAQSDIVTMIILGILAFMSLGSWGISIVKFLKNKSNLRANSAFFRDFLKIKRFVDLQKLCDVSKDSALRTLSVELLKEAGKFKGKVSFESIQHRSSLLEDAIQRSIEGIRMGEDRFLTFLATSSNLAPFFGLLGTVWGIMIAFFQIGHHGSADLTVVAPGIAMALITTVAGLVVAIPASAGYNYFTSKNGSNETSYYNFGSQVLSLFKRGDMLAVEGVAEEEA